MSKDQYVNAIVWLYVIFLLFAGWEYWATRKRSPALYSRRDLVTNIVLGGGSVATNYPFALMVGGGGLVLYDFSPLAQLPTGWKWVVAVLLLDFAYYVAHYLAHNVRFFWATHTVHHSSSYFNLGVGLRNGWTLFLSPLLTFRILILAAGIPLYMILAFTAATLTHQFFLHTRAAVRLPAAIEFLFNTPSHHRVHHALNACYIGRNLGGSLMIWDRMFGTFAAEDHAEPATFTIRPGMHEADWIEVLVRPWAALAHDVIMARSPRQVITALLGRP